MLPVRTAVRDTVNLPELRLSLCGIPPRGFEIYLNLRPDLRTTRASRHKACHLVSGVSFTAIELSRTIHTLLGGRPRRRMHSGSIFTLRMALLRCEQVNR